MLIDGKTIAAEIFSELKHTIEERGTRPHLTVFTCVPNFETQKFLALKKRKAEEIGIAINVIEFPETIITDEVIQSLQRAEPHTNGIVVQLPFPRHIDIDRVLAHVPIALDVDGIHFDGTDEHILPPVAGAIAEIAVRHNVSFSGAKVVVVGSGRLVGGPAALWASKKGADVAIVTEATPDRREKIKTADILILGAGRPRFILPEHVREGVVIFDAGTSESKGMLVGDADPACAEKTSLFTPVPNGIGPVTIAVLLKNLVLLSET